MREIKFRAWYNQDEKMCEVKAITELPTITKWKDGSILMQFTGLKDKNGKEIYEGDIVEFEGNIITIKWGEDSLGFIYDMVKQRDKNVVEDIRLYRLEVSKVIGNIYQNPKLLEKQE